MAEVRSSELETGLSSNGDPEGGDTAVSALEKVCGLDDETMGRFKDRFQFPERVRVHRPINEDGPVISFLVKYASMRQSLPAGLGSPSTPS